jgi:long-chain fatty acid transport protein
MKMFEKRALALALALAVSSPVYATNGMFMIGYGVKSVGMGGVAMAFPQDVFAAAINPAALGEVGTRFDLEATLFLPDASATLGGINSSSRFNAFVLPGLGFAMPVDNETTFGFNMIGAGGGGSHYKQNLYDLNQNPGIPQQNGDLGVELMIMQMNPTIAQKLNKDNTVGFTLVMGLQRFKAFGLGAFQQFTGSNSAESMTNRGVEYSRGLGVRLGWMGKIPNSGITLGAAATSKVYMSKFQNYSELFAEHGDIDTPANIGAGIALKATPKLTFAMDIVRTYYSKVNSIANLGPNTSGGLFPVSKAVNAIGEDGGLGFGWQDQTVYKLGANYEYNSKWTYRTGWNYGKSPIPQDREIAMNIVAPATTQHHVTFGFTNKWNKEMELSFAYMHAFAFSQSGPTYIGNSGTIKMSQNSFGAALGFAFY